MGGGRKIKIPDRIGRALITRGAFAGIEADIFYQGSGWAGFMIPGYLVYLGEDWYVQKVKSR